MERLVMSLNMFFKGESRYFECYVPTMDVPQVKEAVFGYIRSRLRSHYQLNYDPYICDEDDKYSMTECNSERYNVIYSKVKEKDDITRFTFQVINPA